MGAMQTVLVPMLKSSSRNSKGKLHKRLRTHSDGIGRVARLVNAYQGTEQLL